MESIQDKNIIEPQPVNNKIIRPIVRLIVSVLILFISVTAILLFSLFSIPSINEFYIRSKKNAIVDTISINAKTIAKLDDQLKKLKKKYITLAPTQSFLIVNTTYNRFKLYKNKKFFREGFCSTGSYTLLKSHDKRQWVFKTPKGLYRIQGKVTNPVWRRPDWSFVEEGLPIPSQNDPVRWEAGVLGDYALSIGDGYLIHGTIYKRFLGMPVTHGCIRMNDEDLESVYKTLEIGSKVYIY